MNIPKVSIGSVKAGVVDLAKKGKEFASSSIGSAKTLAKDTLEIAKKSPKQAAIIGGVAVGAAAVLGVAAKLAEKGLSHVQFKKHED